MSNYEAKTHNYFPVALMNKTKNNQNSKVPQWQSNRMKTLIAERWQEIWEIVETRGKDKQ